MKKELLTGVVVAGVALTAAARPHWGHGGHHYHVGWGHAGRYGWPAFGAGLVGGLVGNAQLGGRVVVSAPLVVPAPTIVSSPVIYPATTIVPQTQVVYPQQQVVYPQQQVVYPQQQVVYPQQQVVYPQPASAQAAPVQQTIVEKHYYYMTPEAAQAIKSEAVQQRQ